MRPPTPEDKKLGEGIRVRLTNREKELLSERCRKEGYSTLSDFGRAKLLQKREIRRIEASPEFTELITHVTHYFSHYAALGVDNLSSSLCAAFKAA